VTSDQGFAGRVHRLPPLLYWGGGVSLAVAIGFCALLHEQKRMEGIAAHRSPPGTEQPNAPETEPSSTALSPALDVSRQDSVAEIESVAPSQTVEGDTVAMGREEFLRELRKWASRDVDGALASVVNLADEELRGEALEFICYGVAESNPAKAVNLAVSSGLQDRPGAAVQNLVQQWAAADLPSALAWTMKQPDGEQRDECMARVALAYSRRMPADAARLVVDQIPPGPAQTESAIMVLHQWAKQDLPAAAAWVAMFPDGPLRTRAVAELEGISRERKELRR
jgi:hypothetical protein